MTFVQMQTEVGDLLNMTISSSTTVDTTQVKRDLNTARDTVLNRLLSLGQNYNTRLAKTDLVTDQELYGVPTDCRKIVRVEVGYDSSTDRRKASRTDNNAPGDPIYDTSLTSRPRYFLRGENIELRPTPINDVSEGLWLWYIENPADMSGDTDTSGIPFEYDQLLTLYAAAKGSYTLGLHNEGNNYMAQFRLGLDDMEQEIIERNIDDGDRIIIRDEYGGL
jgi:hypothetical protein